MPLPQMGVVICILCSSEDISNIESKELLRYPGGVARLAHLAVQSM